MLSKEKSHKKLDENNAQTIVNGETYNISGLSGDVINIEHNGQITQIDLNKMLNPEVKEFEMCCSPDDYKIRAQNITAAEKKNLFDRIKSLSGDDLVKLSMSTKHIQFLDNTNIDAHFVKNGQTLLLSERDWGKSNLIANHELGPAINNADVNNMLSDNNTFQNIRNYEK